MLVRRETGAGAFNALMSAAMEKQTLSATTVWQLLLTAQEMEPCPWRLLLEEIQKEPGAQAFFRTGRRPGLIAALPSHCQSSRFAVGVNLSPIDFVHGHGICSR